MRSWGRSAVSGMCTAPAFPGAWTHRGTIDYPKAYPERYTAASLEVMISHKLFMLFTFLMIYRSFAPIMRQKRSPCHCRDTIPPLDRVRPAPPWRDPGGGLCGVGHPGFVAFAAVAPMIPMTVPIFSAVTSRLAVSPIPWR
jgi:hypothetical protein